MSRYERIVVAGIGDAGSFSVEAGVSPALFIGSQARRLPLQFTSHACENPKNNEKC
jgi:hypothetical protein